MAVTELHLQDHLTRLSLAPELGASACQPPGRAKPPSAMRLDHGASG